MDIHPLLAGHPTPRDEPHWPPLERAVGLGLAGSFMWMFEVRLGDGRLVQAYKHIFTRRYLHLDDTGAAFEYLERRGIERYQRIPLADALEDTLRPWWEDFDATADETAEAHDAIERARGAEEAA